MKLTPIHCPACQHVISAQARACPNCGHTEILPRPAAKKGYGDLVLVILVVLGLLLWWADKIGRENKASRLEREKADQQVEDISAGRYREPANVRVVK